MKKKVDLTPKEKEELRRGTLSITKYTWHPRKGYQNAWEAFDEVVAEYHKNGMKIPTLSEAMYKGLGKEPFTKEVRSRILNKNEISFNKGVRAGASFAPVRSQRAALKDALRYFHSIKRKK